DNSMLGAVLGQYDEQTREVKVVAASQNQLSYQVQKVIGDFSKYAVKIDDPKFATSVTTTVLRTGQPVFTDKVEDYLAPAVPKQFVPVVSKILSIKSIAAYPVVSRGKIIGVITYFLKDREFDKV